MHHGGYHHGTTCRFSETAKWGKPPPPGKTALVPAPGAGVLREGSALLGREVRPTSSCATCGRAQASSVTCARVQRRDSAGPAHLHLPPLGFETFSETGGLSTLQDAY